MEVVYRCTECSSRFVYEDGVQDFERTRARLQLSHSMRCGGVIEFEGHTVGQKVEALEGAGIGGPAYRPAGSEAKRFMTGP